MKYAQPILLFIIAAAGALSAALLTGPLSLGAVSVAVVAGLVAMGAVKVISPAAPVGPVAPSGSTTAELVSRTYPTTTAIRDSIDMMHADLVTQNEQIKSALASILEATSVAEANDPTVGTVPTEGD